MPESKQDSLPDMLKLMTDVEIKNDVQVMLGTDGPALYTWGDVDTYMKKNADSLEPDVVRSVMQKLRDAYKMRKFNEELTRALEAVQISTIAGGETDNTDNDDNDTDDTDNQILTPLSRNTDVENAGRDENPMDHGLRATTVSQETEHLLPEAPPVRDYRDANGFDHGYAMREALLNPRPDPWALI